MTISGLVYRKMWKPISSHAHHVHRTSLRHKHQQAFYIQCLSTWTVLRNRHGLCGSTPKSKGYDMIVVMTDRLTNYVKIEPMYKTATARDVADILYRSWYRQFGLPQAITCDRDKLFISKFWTELFKKIDIQLRMSTAYHPETDGSSEQVK
jgi:hypothetical protein